MRIPVRRLVGLSAGSAAIALLAAVTGCGSADLLVGDAAARGADGGATATGVRSSSGADAAIPVAGGDTTIDPLAEFFAPGEERRYAAFEASALDVAGTRLPEGLPGPGVMGQKLQDAITTLGDPAASEEVHQAAVDQVMESLFMSNLVVLPTAGVPEADPLVGMHDQMIQDAINALSGHINPTGPGTPNSKDAAWEARNFLQIFQEAMQVIGQQTAACSPENLRDPACELLLDDDEGGTDVDGIFPGFSRQVRSPFFVGVGSSVIQEQVIVPGTIAPDECSVVLKEIQGVKAVVRKVTIPIWVEPWFARATIVGYRVVWVWEFIPAEFLKTISFCNSGGEVVQDVDIVVVLERELTHFWGFPAKDITVFP